MAKFAVENAELSCQYGIHRCKMERLAERHVATCHGAAEKENGQVANEFDYLSDNNGCFGGCGSPYHPGAALGEMRIGITNLQQLAASGGRIAPCVYQVLFRWQEVNPHVHIAKGCAMMQDCWTVCLEGLGIVSVVDSGQRENNPAQDMLEKLEALECAVTQYMKENGIKESRKDALIESILLWNGYESIPWKYESSEEKRAFCTYMERENPVLFNYFERGLYLGEGEAQIDLTYMLGIYKAVGQSSFDEDCITAEMVNDTAMFNGYLEAVRQEHGKGLGEVLADYVAYYNSPQYDSKRCYADFAARTPEETRQYFCRDHPLETEGKSVQEINLLLLEYTFQHNYDLGETAQIFMDKLRSGLDRGEQ